MTDELVDNVKCSYQLYLPSSKKEDISTDSFWIDTICRQHFLWIYCTPSVPKISDVDLHRFLYKSGTEGVVLYLKPSVQFGTSDLWWK